VKLRVRALLLATLIIVVDLLSKAAVLNTIGLAGYVNLPGPIALSPLRNGGAVLGLFVEQPELLLLGSLFAVLILVRLLLSTRRRPMETIALALLSGGAAGNLIDRATGGGVLDFIDLGTGTLHLPVFNVADAAISAGLALLLLWAVIGRSALAGRETEVD
jgi:signal peptidase II